MRPYSVSHVWIMQQYSVDDSVTPKVQTFLQLSSKKMATNPSIVQILGIIFFWRHLTTIEETEGGNAV